ncbi:MAG: hypothetical protein VCC01_02505 [Candidatus Hydrogenedentota bacterium]
MRRLKEENGSLVKRIWIIQVSSKQWTSMSGKDREARTSVYVLSYFSVTGLGHMV